MTTDEHPTGETKTVGGTARDRGAQAIVVVDDDTTWLSDLQTWLAEDGFTVVGISRGEWVIEAVEWHEPYAVIVDLQLPGTDGLEILRQVRRRRPHIPVVVMTAFGGPDVQDRVRRLGAAGYFNKPFLVENLVTALRAFRPPMAG
jgi:DNA-binding response OmpR family regulator